MQRQHAKNKVEEEEEGENHLRSQHHRHHPHKSSSSSHVLLLGQADYGVWSKQATSATYYLLPAAAAAVAAGVTFAAAVEVEKCFHFSNHSNLLCSSSSRAWEKKEEAFADPQRSFMGKRSSMALGVSSCGMIVLLYGLVRSWWENNNNDKRWKKQRCDEKVMKQSEIGWRKKNK